MSGLLLLVASWSVCARAEPQEAPKPPAKAEDTSERVLREWVRQIGDTKFETREAATRSLIQAGPRSIPLVREVFQNPDPEVRRRALEVATQVERRSVAVLERLGASVQRDSVDLSVRVICIDRTKADRLTDADLVHLNAFPDLEDLSLEGTLMTDAGLAHVGRLLGLKRLSLTKTGITDTGLNHLGGLVNLEWLWLNETRVIGSGLKHLKPLKNLQQLALDGTPLTDAGLAEGIAGLQKLPQLRALGLANTEITDASLVSLKKLESLTSLSLAHTLITDAGLVHLKALPNLCHLDLSSTSITDAGFNHLAAMKGLKSIFLGGTRFTVKGLKKLAALPDLKHLALTDRIRAQSLTEAIALLSRSVPPTFVTIKKVNRQEWTVLYEEKFPEDVLEKAVVPTPNGKKEIQFFRQMTETVHVWYSVRNQPVFDGEGKRLSGQEALRRIAVGTTVLVSADGKMVSAEYLKTLRKETLIFVPSAQEPGPETPIAP